MYCGFALIYACKYVHIILLIFTEIAEINMTSLNSLAVRVGTTHTITCEALGYPPPTVAWSRTSGSLSARASVSGSVSVPTGYGNVTRVSVNLTIAGILREDGGGYKCFSNNSLGEDNKIVNIESKLFYVRSMSFLMLMQITF